MKYRAEMSVQFAGDLALLDERTDQLMDQLLDIEEADPAIEDPDIAATLSTGIVQISMFIKADDLPEAGQKLVATVRHALHAIGDGTPGWERVAREVQEQCMSVSPVRDR
ncbi:hypothetical protein, partial [Nonomuraea pusilla]